MRVTRLSVGAVIAVLLSTGSDFAEALEDCAAAYDRRDYAAAVQLCRPLAEKGDARAQLSLGGMYYNGQGVRQDYAEAAEWTRKAAEQRASSGHSPAAWRSGQIDPQRRSRWRRNQASTPLPRIDSYHAASLSL